MSHPPKLAYLGQFWAIKVVFELSVIKTTGDTSVWHITQTCLRRISSSRCRSRMSYSTVTAANRRSSNWCRSLSAVACCCLRCCCKMAALICSLTSISSTWRLCSWVEILKNIMQKKLSRICTLKAILLDDTDLAVCVHSFARCEFMCSTHLEFSPLSARASSPHHRSVYNSKPTSSPSSSP